MSDLEKEKTKLKCINNGSSNELARMSIAFKKRLNRIERVRSELGINKLSNPKITELIIRHKLWPRIEEDIINFTLKEGDGDYDE